MMPWILVGARCRNSFKVFGPLQSLDANRGIAVTWFLPLWVSSYFVKYPGQFFVVSREFATFDREVRSDGR